MGFDAMQAMLEVVDWCDGERVDPEISQAINSLMRNTGGGRIWLDWRSLNSMKQVWRS